MAEDGKTQLQDTPVVAKLLSIDVGDLTEEHPKQASRTWRRQQPHLTNLLRLNVNREQLVTQLEDLVANDNVYYLFLASLLHMNLVVGTKGAFYACVPHFCNVEGHGNWGPAHSKKPPEPGHEHNSKSKSAFEYCVSQANRSNFRGCFSSRIAKRAAR